jgi:nitrogenase-stabilizing/protective protein
VGEYFAQQAQTPATEDELRERCTSQLRKAYEEFVAHTPVEARLFKVHKDAQRAQQKKLARVLVPLSSLRSVARKD